jgi:hypothetical protein
MRRRERPSQTSAHLTRRYAPDGVTQLKDLVLYIQTMLGKVCNHLQLMSPHHGKDKPDQAMKILEFMKRSFGMSETNSALLLRLLTLLQVMRYSSSTVSAFRSKTMFRYRARSAF